MQTHPPSLSLRRVLALSVLLASGGATAQTATRSAPSLPTPVRADASVQPDAPATHRAAAAMGEAYRNPATCLSSEVHQFEDSNTPSAYTFGPNDFVTGIPAPTLGAAGWYESIDGVAPGKEVCQVQAALGFCANPSGTLSVRVVIYAPDAVTPTLPDFMAPLGASAPFDPVAAGCPGAPSYTFVEIPMVTPVDLEDRTTFVVGLEVVQAGSGDSVVLISSAQGQGGGIGRNSTATTNFGLIDYLTFVGLDFTLGFRFNSTIARLTGTEGWRLMAAPSTSATVGGGGAGAGFLDFLWTQGYTGADGGETVPGASNVFRYDETVTGTLSDGYVPPASATEALAPGTGLFVYVFEDDDRSTPAIEGGFPKTVEVAGPEPTLPFVFAPTFTPSGNTVDDGWMLLGNPFRNGLNWDAPGWAKVAMSNAIYVYDPATDMYLTWNGTVGDLLSGVVGPFQGFWAQAMGATPELVAPGGSVVGGGTFIGRPEAVPTVTLAVETLAGQIGTDLAYVTLQEGASEGLDRFDAFELAGVSTPPVRLFAVAEHPEGPLALNIAALPAGGTHEVRLGVAAAEAGPAVLRWPEVSIPDGWQVSLLDTETGTEIDLRTETEYAFSATSTEVAPVGRQGSASLPGAPPMARLRLPDGDAADPTLVGRFVLHFEASTVGTDDTAPEPSSVSQVYPNPTAGSSAIRISVNAPERVRVVVYDALGRVVHVAFDATIAGEAEVDLGTSRLAPGTYVVRVEGPAGVDLRRVAVAR